MTLETVKIKVNKIHETYLGLYKAYLGLSDKSIYHFIVFPILLPLALIAIWTVFMILDWVVRYNPYLEVLLIAVFIYITLVFIGFIINQKLVLELIKKIK